MKFFLAILLVFSSSTFASYVPNFKAELNTDNRIELTVESELTNPIECISLVVWSKEDPNGPSMNMQVGYFEMSAGPSKYSALMDSDPADVIYDIHADVECEEI